MKVHLGMLPKVAHIYLYKYKSLIILFFKKGPVDIQKDEKNLTKNKICIFNYYTLSQL